MKALVQLNTFIRNKSKLFKETEKSKDGAVAEQKEDDNGNEFLLQHLEKIELLEDACSYVSSPTVDRIRTVRSLLLPSKNPKSDVAVTASQWMQLTSLPPPKIMMSPTRGASAESSNSSEKIMFSDVETCPKWLVQFHWDEPKIESWFISCTSYIGSETVLSMSEISNVSNQSVRMITIPLSNILSVVLPAVDDDPVGVDTQAAYTCDEDDEGNGKKNDDNQLMHTEFQIHFKVDDDKNRVTYNEVVLRFTPNTQPDADCYFSGSNVVVDYPLFWVDALLAALELLKLKIAWKGNPKQFIDIRAAWYNSKTSNDVSLFKKILRSKIGISSSSTDDKNGDNTESSKFFNIAKSIVFGRKSSEVESRSVLVKKKEKGHHQGRKVTFNGHEQSRESVTDEDNPLKAAHALRTDPPLPSSFFKPPGAVSNGQNGMPNIDFSVYHKVDNEYRRSSPYKQRPPPVKAVDSSSIAVKSNDKTILSKDLKSPVAGVPSQSLSFKDLRESIRLRQAIVPGVGSGEGGYASPVKSNVVPVVGAERAPVDIKTPLSATNIAVPANLSASLQNPVPVVSAEVTPSSPGKTRVHYIAVTSSSSSSHVKSSHVKTESAAIANQPLVKSKPTAASLSAKEDKLGSSLVLSAWYVQQGFQLFPAIPNGNILTELTLVTPRPPKLQSKHRHRTSPYIKVKVLPVPGLLPAQCSEECINFKDILSVNISDEQNNLFNIIAFRKLPTDNDKILRVKKSFVFAVFCGDYDDKDEAVTEMKNWIELLENLRLAFEIARKREPLEGAADDIAEGGLRVEVDTRADQGISSSSKPSHGRKHTNINVSLSPMVAAKNVVPFQTTDSLPAAPRKELSIHERLYQYPTIGSLAKDERHNRVEMPELPSPSKVIGKNLMVLSDISSKIDRLLSFNDLPDMEDD